MYNLSLVLEALSLLHPLSLRFAWIEDFDDEILLVKYANGSIGKVLLSEWRQNDINVSFPVFDLSAINISGPGKKTKRICQFI